MLKNIVMRYIIYTIYFLGIGMVSSGIVLMPFNTTRYGTILIVGLLLFSTGSFINDVILEKKILTLVDRIKLVLVSLTLAIGIGMISGGIAHFKESPSYVSYLIPIGIIVSCVSFIIKNGYKLTKKEKLVMATFLIIISLVAHTGLFLASQQTDKGVNGGDIFQGHGMQD